MQARWSMILATFLILSGGIARAQINLTANLVKDGGMEAWREVRAEAGQYNSLKKLQVSYAANGNILMPSAYEQGAFSVCQREEKDVCSGKYSLRLKAESFYLHYAFEGAYAARRGDLYVARFMAKGKGSATMYLTVYGDGGAAYTLEQKGAPVPDRWTQIEQRILVGGAAPDRIYPRLSVTGDMLIDDVYLARVLREDEAVIARQVPREYDERIAFAPSVAEAPVIDGKLDEACWKTAVPFSGFRLSREQTLLAPEQASFRVLYDDQAVYFGIEIPLADAESVLAELKAKPRKGDQGGDVFSDRHSIELFLQAPGQSRYIQCVAALDGCRYDGTGVGKENSAWTGQWTFGVSAEKGRWRLEVRVPAADLNLKTIPAGEGWRLNVVDNREGNYATWAAVGNNYHTPFNFGALVTRDFAAWRQEKLAGWEVLRKKAAAGAETYGLAFADRLERAAAFAQALPAPADGKTPGWETITSVYAQMNFVDAVYRGMDAEMAYARLFAPKSARGEDSAAQGVSSDNGQRQ